MFSYLDPDQPPSQPQKPSLTRSDSAERRVKWKDQQVDEESSSSYESGDELPRPAVIHFTHTKEDAQQVSLIEQGPSPQIILLYGIKTKAAINFILDLHGKKY